MVSAFCCLVAVVVHSHAVGGVPVETVEFDGNPKLRKPDVQFLFTGQYASSVHYHGAVIARFDEVANLLVLPRDGSSLASNASSRLEVGDRCLFELTVLLADDGHLFGVCRVFHHRVVVRISMNGPGSLDKHVFSKRAGEGNAMTSTPRAAPCGQVVVRLLREVPVHRAPDDNRHLAALIHDLAVVILVLMSRACFQDELFLAITADAMAFYCSARRAPVSQQMTIGRNEEVSMGRTGDGHLDRSPAEDDVIVGVGIAESVLSSGHEGRQVVIDMVLCLFAGGTSSVPEVPLGGGCEQAVLWTSNRDIFTEAVEDRGRVVVSSVVPDCRLFEEVFWSQAVVFASLLRYTKRTSLSTSVGHESLLKRAVVRADDGDHAVVFHIFLQKVIAVASAVRLVRLADPLFAGPPFLRHADKYRLTKLI